MSGLALAGDALFRGTPRVAARRKGIESGARLGALAEVELSELVRDLEDVATSG